MDVLAHCDGSSECQAAEHIEGCFATTKRHAQRSWAERYAGPTLEQQLAGAVEELERLRKFARMVADGDHADACGGLFEEPEGCWGDLAHAALRGQ